MGAATARRDGRMGVEGWIMSSRSKLSAMLGSLVCVVARERAHTNGGMYPSNGRDAAVLHEGATSV